MRNLYITSIMDMLNKISSERFLRQIYIILKHYIEKGGAAV